MMRDPEKTIGNIIDKTAVSIIGSIDESDFPNTKAMLPPRKREGIKYIYFTTNELKGVGPTLFTKRNNSGIGELILETAKPFGKP